MPEPIAEILRAKFRASQAGRYWLHQSWVQRQTRFSTDGRIILCEPAPGAPDTDDPEGRWPNAFLLTRALGLPEMLKSGPWSQSKLPGPADEPWQPRKARLLVRLTERWLTEACIAWLLNQLPGLRWRIMDAKPDPVLLFQCDSGAFGFCACIEDSPLLLPSDFWQTEATRA